MATLTTTELQAYAHCRDPRCAGTEQQPVPALRHLSEWTYVENGGNMPGTERSTAILAFADEPTDAPCPTCSKPRELSEQERPYYTPLSGHRQDGLLHVKSFDASQQPPAGNDAVIAQLMAQVAQLSAHIAGQHPGGNNTAPVAEAAPQVDTLEEHRAQEIKQRRLDALAKARAVRSANAKKTNEAP